MVCAKYDELHHKDKIQFVGRLIHATQSDDKLFELASDIIKIADLRGLFDGVEIMPGQKERSGNGL